MKREHRLRYIIKEGLLDTFYIWKDELRNVFKDAGVMIFFFLVPFVYPLLYSFIYNNEVVHEAKMVVVDQSDSYLSREFTRRVNATPDVEVVGVCPDMAEAKKMLDEKKAYGILLFPPDYSKDLHEGRQTTVSLYCDMSALLFYKAFLLAATEVSLDMGKELRMHNNPSSTDKMDQITVDPIPYESVALFNSQNGFASFLVPAILILVLQQTLILGIGMLGGTARDKIRPYIIHRTSLGCYERTLAWLIEHYAGKFPTWLCPEQVRVLPISEKYADYAKKVADELKRNDVDVTVDNRAEKIGYKIREARMDKLPYMLVVGADEEADGTVSVRSRFEGNEGVKPLSDFIDQICKEIRTKEIRVELPEEEKHR